MKRELKIIYNVVGVTLTLFFGALAWQQRRWRRINGGSRAVARWTPGNRSAVTVGGVTATVRGDAHAERAFVVLHGLNTTGGYFGSAWDQLAGPNTRLVVPDLLGFGRSMDRSLHADAFSIEQHADAVAALVDVAVDARAKVTLAAHSMGSLVALRLAGLPGSQVDSLVLFAPTLHDSVEEAERHVSDRGFAAKIFALDRWSSRVACRNICTRPWLARWLARTIAPAMPTGIADATHEHSWESHVGTLRATFGRREWRDELAQLQARGVRVTIVVGERDNSIDRELIAGIPGIEVVDEHDLTGGAPVGGNGNGAGVHPLLVTRSDAGHQIPLTDAEWCAEVVRGAARHDEVVPAQPIAALN